MQSDLVLRRVRNVVHDPTPDERGQLMVAVIVDGGESVAIILSAN